MVNALGAQIGLLAFTAAVVAGLTAGNGITSVLTRAIIALVLGSIAGQMAGWGAKAVLRDYLQKRKREIDEEHFKAMNELEGDAPQQEAVGEVAQGEQA